jgi:tetratricopeptide (TPR) repeat protein
VARNSGNPYLNDAAYILADTNTDLALAKEWANKAGSIEEQTKMVTLDALTDQDLARMRGLDDYWDTLGWIYFRAGEDAKAETFLRAAWMLGQKATIGDHLGQILEHRGNLEGARRAYELALARDQGFYETRERLKRLHATGAAATEQELGKLLSTGVPGLPERNAIAEFFVLFSPGKIEDVRFIGGNAELKDAGAVLKKAQFDVPFPQGSAAKLVRRGILSCSPETSPHCHFDLVLPSEAKK